MYLVKNLYKEYKNLLKIELLSTNSTILNKKIKKPEVQRPGLSLTGYTKSFMFSRILVFGKGEIQYIKELSSEMRYTVLDNLLTKTTPAVFIAKKSKVPNELVGICKKYNIPLFLSSLPTSDVYRKLSILLAQEFCPNIVLHGTLVEVFGVGVLLQGESAIGKSETALGLVERGHRLVSDDAVRIRKKEGDILVGEGLEIAKHLLEIRGIGIINVAHLYGAVCVRPDKRIDIIVQLEKWNDQHFYDRVGSEKVYKEILSVSIAYHLLPVKPGRDIVLLVETIARCHRLKDMGYNSAKDFNGRLLHTLAKKGSKIDALGKEVKSTK